MRDAAPMYYSAQCEFSALSRYEKVAAAFKDFATHSPSRGVALGEIPDATALRVSNPPPEWIRRITAACAP
jgi:hypothetical protein